VNPFDTNTPIPEDGISNFQREAAYILVTGKGLKNPLINRIERAKGCIQRQIDEFDLIIEVIESGIESANGCLQCGDFPYQCALDVKSKLEELLFEVELLEIHTNRISGSEVNRVDEFLSRLTLAGQYTRAMKTLTGEDKERYTHVFNSLINGDFCMDKICKDTMCEPGDALCSEFNTQSGIGGLAIRLKANPAACGCAINQLIPGLIECVSGLIADDELNYCEAIRVVRKYSGGTQLTTEALNDPLVSQLLDNLFASNALKGPLKKIRDGNLNAEEIEQETKKYYEEFVDPGGTFDCGLEGVTVVAGATGPPGPQGAPGCAGPPGEPGQNCNCPGDDPTGACCVGEYCTQVTAQQCAFFGGDYYGDGSLCYDPSTGLGVRCFPEGGCGIDEDCNPGQICCNGQCTTPCPPFPDGTGGGGCPPCAPCPSGSTECPAGSGNCCPTGSGLFVCCNGECVQPCPYAGGCPECQDGSCCDAPGEICCGGSCCTLERCCGNGFCCDDNETCCGGNGPCCPEGDCCNGTCLNRLTQQCCNGVPKPINELCCEEFEGEGECNECDQVRPGIHPGCGYAEDGNTIETLSVADICCGGECCDIDDGSGNGAQHDCCFDYEYCCPGAGGCCSGPCCTGTCGRDDCCTEEKPFCCGENDCCDLDQEQCCGGDCDAFCCDKDWDCCDCGYDMFGDPQPNVCIEPPKGPTTPGSPSSICYSCLEYDAQRYPDYVYVGGCKCGCPDGYIESCGTVDGEEVCICCDNDLKPCGESPFGPECCDPDLNEECCPPKPGVWPGGCKDVGDCDCDTEQCYDGGPCCEVGVDIGFYKQECTGNEVCLGTEVLVDGAVKCFADQFCCGNECKLITDCTKFLDDYVNFGDYPDDWSSVCCCSGSGSPTWCEKGCCCEGTCASGTKYGVNGCAKSCDEGAAYDLTGSSGVGCKCDCYASGGIYPQGCTRFCQDGETSYNPYECGDPDSVCSDPDDCDYAGGQFKALACSGIFECFDPIDTSECNIQLCIAPQCAGDFNGGIDCNREDCMVYCRNEEMTPCDQDLEGESEECKPSLIHQDSIQCFQPLFGIGGCSATCQTIPAPGGGGGNPLPFAGIGSGGEQTGQQNPNAQAGPTITPGGDPEIGPGPGGLVDGVNKEKYICGPACPDNSLGNCGFDDCNNECPVGDCCGTCDAVGLLGEGSGGSYPVLPLSSPLPTFGAGADGILPDEGDTSSGGSSRSSGSSSRSSGGSMMGGSSSSGGGY